MKEDILVVGVGVLLCKKEDLGWDTGPTQVEALSVQQMCQNLIRACLSRLV